MTKELIDLTPQAEDKVVAAINKQAEETRQLRGAIEDMSALIQGLITGNKINRI